MRLIDANEAREALQKEINKGIAPFDDTMGAIRCGLRLARNIIEDLPVIEAEPIRHGRWLHGREVSRDYIGDACVAIHYEKWWCSKCNYTVDGEPLWNYCPSCGAKMEAE